MGVVEVGSERIPLHFLRKNKERKEVDKKRYSKKKTERFLQEVPRGAGLLKHGRDSSNNEGVYSEDEEKIRFFG